MDKISYKLNNKININYHYKIWVTFQAKLIFLFFFLSIFYFSFQLVIFSTFLMDRYRQIKKRKKIPLDAITLSSLIHKICIYFLLFVFENICPILFPLSLSQSLPVSSDERSNLCTYTSPFFPTSHMSPIIPWAPEAGNCVLGKESRARPHSNTHT